MARAVRPEHPYSSLIDEILALSKRQPGWNSYGARPITHTTRKPASWKLLVGALLIR